ncbi:MAG: hypothetical protein Q8908_06540 [Bacteroidota bacterium]|nr:hypothetical protein [Bacteroidota bacterium]
MKLNILRSCILIVLFFSLSSWGEKGHYKINSSCTQSFPHRIRNLKTWSAALAAHASDADKRRSQDPYEANRHYIDIDNYPGFTADHKIIENRDSAYRNYTRKFIYKNGSLPWTTDSTYHALVQNFRAKDWSRAMLTAAYMGHYIGDGHMPLHLTANYDGKFTSQSGIHDRYESKMINQYYDEITFNRSRVKKVKDVRSYIFKYIYNNYQYKDSLLAADKKAYAEAGNEYSKAYYQLLWKSTKHFTVALLANSSRSMAELIYTAWIEAGKPKIPKNLNPGE